MAEANSEKVAALKQRMKFNFEVFSAIREVKALGWEDVIMDRNRQFRQRENANNERYLTFSNVYDLMINLTPTLSVLLMFLLEFMTKGKLRLDPVRVFTVLSFVALTNGPAKSLLTVMVSWKNGADAFKRVASFLAEAEELD